MKFSAKNTLARWMNLICLTGQFLYGSTQNCPNEEKSLDFRVSHAQLDEVTFEWQHPRCIENNFGIDYYNIAIIGPDGKLYQSNVGKVTRYTVKSVNQRGTGSQLENLPIIPCFQYEATLVGIDSYWRGSTKVVEESLDFVVPLVPGDIPGIVTASTGPGWVALFWNMGKACYETKYGGYRLHSFKLRISGGRQQEEQSLELSMEKDGHLDSLEDIFFFNLTNDNKECAKVWCWQPCTSYSLEISGITLNQSGFLSTMHIRLEFGITTTIEKLDKDAAPQDLALVDRGADWLYLRWKRPYCLPNSSNPYKLIQIQSNNKATSCPESISWKDLRNDTENIYHFYYMTSLCDQKLKPCTGYKFRIRGEFSDQIEGRHRKSNDLVATTLPPSVKDLKLIPKPRSPLKLQLSWSRAPNCSVYPIQKYHLLLKVHSNPEVYKTQEISGNCDGFSVCEFDFGFELLPCTKYEAAVTPIYANLREAIPPSVASFQTSFPAPGENYSIISDSAGSSWASLSLKLPPQCLRFVENFYLNLYGEDTRDGPKTARVSNECFQVNNENGTVRFNVTQSSCFPSFSHIKTCTGRYEVEILPEVPAGLMGAMPEALQTSFQLMNPDLTSIANVTIRERGENWIYLDWTPPLCTQNLGPGTPYLISIFDATSTYSRCFFRRMATQTYTNATSKTWCLYTGKYLQLESCTEYYFEVKAEFTPQDLNAKAKPTWSNVVRTLPNPSQTYVENLTVSQVGNTRPIVSWQPPICAHFTTRYQLELQDFSQGGAIVVSATIPKACLDASNQLEWPPTTDCGININQGQNPNALEPCTDYKLIVWPRIETHKGSRNGAQRDTTFTTESASPGKVCYLNLTARTETTLSIAWGNVTQNARCLQSYEVSVKDKAGKELNDKFHVNRNSYTFNNLKLCSTYEIAVRSVGKPGDEVLAEIREFSTPESQPGPPENLNYSTLLHNSVILTWDEPNDNPACMGDYLINIFEVESNNTEMVYKNITTKSRYTVVSDLKPGTKYEFYVIARTKSTNMNSYPVILNITTLNPDSAFQSHHVYIILVVILIVISIVSVIAYCCYCRGHWSTFLAYIKNKDFLVACRRSFPPYSRDEPVEPEVPADAEITRTSRRVSTHCMRNLAIQRPIPVEQFDTFLNELTETRSNLLREQFVDLKVLSNENQPKTHAAKIQNKNKNRYNNILPYDNTRVPLSPLAGDEHGDYINASYVQGFDGAREYIAAQGPKPETVPDFWRMIWEQDVCLVVMVTQLVEKGKIKCAQYWPDQNQVLSYGAIKVTPVLQIKMDDYFIRDWEVEHNGTKRTIKQMHFLSWPDFGCPQNPESMLSFIEAVRDRVVSLSAGGPILIHCSAGVGRTGTFIAIDWLTREARLNSQLDVFNTVLKLRSDRMNMVQTEDQFLFVHKCLSHFLKTRIRESSPIYANMI